MRNWEYLRYMEHPVYTHNSIVDIRYYTTWRKSVKFWWKETGAKSLEISTRIFEIAYDKSYIYVNAAIKMQRDKIHTENWTCIWSSAINQYECDFKWKVQWPSTTIRENSLNDFWKLLAVCTVLSEITV